MTNILSLRSKSFLIFHNERYNTTVYSQRIQYKSHILPSHIYSRYLCPLLIYYLNFIFILQIIHTCVPSLPCFADQRGMDSPSASQLKSSEDDADKVCNRSIVVPHRVVALANSFEKKDRSWYVIVHKLESTRVLGS